MIEGKLKCGFEVKVPEENIDDYELFEELASIDNDGNNSGKIVPAYIRLLGEEQYEALKEHIRSKKTGRISRNEMFEILSEILTINDEAKN